MVRAEQAERIAVRIAEFDELVVHEPRGDDPAPPPRRPVVLRDAAPDPDAERRNVRFGHEVWTIRHGQTAAAWAPYVAGPGSTTLQHSWGSLLER